MRRLAEFEPTELPFVSWLLQEVGGVGALLRYRLQPPSTDSAPQPQHA